VSVAVDASSPIRFSGVLASGGTTVSASFTAPANSLIVVCVESDGATASQGTVTNAVTDSGGLAWTKQVERTVAEATDGGMSAIWTAPQVSSAARTVTITHTRSSGADVRVTGKVYVVTGTSLAVDTVAAANEGGSATNNLTTTSITPGGTGLLIAADCDWTAGGDANHEAGDLTQDTTFWAGLISVCDGHKACTEAVGVTANLNSGGTAAAQHKWCQVVVREPPVYPQLRGVGAFGSGTTSFTAAVPTGGSAPVAGDAMYIIMESSDSSTTAGTPTTPGGWSKLGENTIGAGATNVTTLTIFGKIAGAGEGNVTVNGVGDHCAGAMVVVYNHGLSVITDTVVGAFTDHGTSTTNVLAASITVTAKSFVITAMGLSDDANDTSNVSGVTNANLAGITERIDQTVSTGAGGGVGIYTSTCAGTTTGTTEWDHDTAVNSQSVQLGVKPATTAAYVMTADPGSYALSGASASAFADRMISASPGAYALTGADAGLSKGLQLLADPGSYSLAGADVGFLADRMLSADPGGYSLVGADASTLVGRVLTAVAGAYVLEGADALLVYVPLAGFYVLTAEPGAYAVTGADADTLADRLLGADPGAYTVAGADADALVRRRRWGVPARGPRRGSGLGARSRGLCADRQPGKLQPQRRRHRAAQRHCRRSPARLAAYPGVAPRRLASTPPKIEGLTAGRTCGRFRA